MKKVKKIMEVFALTALTIGLFTALILDSAAFSAKQEDIRNRTGYPPAVGAKAPAFSLEKLDESQTVQSDEIFNDGKTLLIFSAPGCSILHDLLQSMIKGDMDPALVSIAFFDVTDSNLGQAVQYSKEYPDFTFYREVSHSIAWNYKITATPILFLVDEEGTILYRRIGGTATNDEDFLNIKKKLY